jgi:hypothetical protein
MDIGGGYFLGQCLLYATSVSSEQAVTKEPMVVSDNGQQPFCGGGFRASVQFIRALCTTVLVLMLTLLIFSLWLELVQILRLGLGASTFLPMVCLAVGTTVLQLPSASPSESVMTACI